MTQYVNNYFEAYRKLFMHSIRLQSASFLLMQKYKTMNPDILYNYAFVMQEASRGIDDALKNLDQSFHDYFTRLQNNKVPDAATSDAEHPLTIMEYLSHYHDLLVHLSKVRDDFTLLTLKQTLPNDLHRHCQVLSQYVERAFEAAIRIEGMQHYLIHGATCECRTKEAPKPE
jgi:hypothetical protein